MSQLFAGGLCACKVIRSSVRVSMFLLIAPAIFGQSYRGLPSPGGPDFHFWDSIDIRVPKQKSTTSNIVTLQELQHVVPKKALKEVEKAEAARLDNRNDAAIRHYCEAISIDPEFVAARNNLAVVYLTTASGEAAIAQLEAAIKVDPNKPLLFTNLASGYAMIHQYDAAERAARVAVNLDRANPLPRFILALALTAQRKSADEAVQYFEVAGRTYTEAYFFAARLLITDGQLKRAKSEIQTYLAGADDQQKRAVAMHWLDLIDQSEQVSVTSLSLARSRY